MFASFMFAVLGPGLCVLAARAARACGALLLDLGWDYVDATGGTNFERCGVDGR